MAPTARARVALPLCVLAACASSVVDLGQGDENGPGPRGGGKVTAPDLFAMGAKEADRGEWTGPVGGMAPRPLYPLHGAMLAKNISKMHIMWSAGLDVRHFRITLESDTFAQTIYLSAQACMGVMCGYRVEDAVWQRFASASAGRPAALTISATWGAGQPIGTSEKVALYFSPEDVRGGMYYFSTSRYGLMRVPFGGSAAVPFVLGKGARDESIHRCVGCHAVSRDGKKVAAVWGTADGYAGIVDGADPTRFLLRPREPRAGDPWPTPGQMWNFASFSPDGSKLVTVWNGVLSLRRGADGSLIQTIDPRFVGGRATMPEWSPDGKWIVYVRLPEEGRLGSDISLRDIEGNPYFPAGDWLLQNAGDIAMVEIFPDGSLGRSVTVVPSRAGVEYHFYPSFSPDSRFIVFNSARPGECFSAMVTRFPVTVSAGACYSYDQKAARLRLARAAENATPIELTAATHEQGKTAAWPKFAPFQQRGSRLVFVTFSAKLDYGWEIQQASLMKSGEGERPQLWMAAIDLEKAESFDLRMEDPSYRPFWLPFQDMKTNNHEAIWTTDIACVQAAECGSPSEFDCVSGMCQRKIG